MEKFFNIRYEFDQSKVLDEISHTLIEKRKGYICVCDGVIVNEVQHNQKYRDIINGSLFSICDSSWIPVYLKILYGIRREQYSGCQIFHDLLAAKKYEMYFLGTDQKTLNSLKAELIKLDSRIENMTFAELPFCSVDSFDYKKIATDINSLQPHIIWVALGAPKQEIFMSNLLPYLDAGILIAVGAVFKFFGDSQVKRAPAWMIKIHLEFIHRIFSEPRKQIGRVKGILLNLPRLLYSEWKNKIHKAKVHT